MIFDDLAAADHWILSRGPVVAGTVFEPPHVRVVRSPTAGGRAVRFPGSDGLTGVRPLSEVLPIMRIVLLGGGTVDPASMLDTRDFVRPVWTSEGELVLTTMPAGDGILVPFETRHPTPCCAAH